MKRLILLLAALAVALPTMWGQGSKVLERSSKEKPAWLYEAPKDYILVEVEAPDMSTARDRAMEELARRIVMAVATNVAHSTSSGASMQMVDGNVNESEHFSYDTQMAAANIPFIKGISLTEAKDIYWEKHQQKKTNRIFYNYAVLYPLPASELKKMRDEFEKRDAEKSATLARLKAQLNTVSSTNQIEQAVAQLDELKAYFFDKARRAEAEGLQTSYKKLYKGLTFESTTPSGGAFTITLMLNGRPFEVTGQPTLKSNCATRLSADPDSEGTGFDITYDDIDCLQDEDNWIEISLRLRDARITKRVYL